jgi:hypothetical protein
MARKKLIKDHNLSTEQYEEMLRVQNGKCAICKGNETRKFWKNLCIDHDHKTGKVRGLLCHHCNTMLGNVKDNPEILQSAIEYLKMATYL